MGGVVERAILAGLQNREVESSSVCGRASWHDFLRHRIARHSRGLGRQQSVCWVFSTVSAAHWRRVQSKVSGRKFPFPELLFTTGSSRVRVRARDEDRMASIGQALATKQLSERRSYLCSCWRLESERAPLVRPRHRKINETFETETSRQMSFDCRLDDIRRKESERQGHPDRTLALALSRSQRLQSLARIGPEVRRANDGRRQELRSGLRARRLASGGRACCIACALDDLALAKGRGRRPGECQNPRAPFGLRKLRQLN